MKKCFLLCPIIILGVGILIYYYGAFNWQKQLPEGSQRIKQQENGGSQKQWETKIDEQQSVVVKVTPIEFGENYKIWKFAIVLDTHSGSLDEDLVEITTLLDNQGGVYRPIAWEGAAPGGHHREGILTFNAIKPAPASIKLKIKNIGGVPERLFVW